MTNIKEQYTLITQSLETLTEQAKAYRKTNARAQRIYKNLKKSEKDFHLHLLLLFTAATETGWRTRTQTRGPALGFCQLEPTTVKWLLEKYPFIYPSYVTYGKVCDELPFEKGDRLNYILARMRYYTTPEPIPKLCLKKKASLADFYDYYKKHYNTFEGKATRKHFYEAVSDVLLDDWLIRESLKHDY